MTKDSPIQGRRGSKDLPVSECYLREDAGEQVFFRALTAVIAFLSYPSEYVLSRRFPHFSLPDLLSVSCERTPALLLQIC